MPFPTHRLSDVNVESKTAICLACGPVGIVFRDRGQKRFQWACIEKERARARRRYKSPKQKEYHAKYSKQWALANKDKVSKFNRTALLKYHGLTAADYDNMVASRDSRCDICHEQVKKLSVDHDHSDLKIRGLLCLHCNFMLGFAKDRVALLTSAIAYLERVI